VPNNSTPARVINISLGASGVCSAAYQDVINRVRAAGVAEVDSQPVERGDLEALEERRRYQAVVDALAPAMASFRSSADSGVALSTLLPHLGFAHQQLGQHDKAIAAFEEARKISPADPIVTGYLVQAQIAAKNYGAAADLARAARADRPDDLQLARLAAHALRQDGRGDQRIGLLAGLLPRPGGLPRGRVEPAISPGTSHPTHLRRLGKRNGANR